MAVKIVRQPKNIALLGAPTSAASLAAGHERAPAALRAAGLGCAADRGGICGHRLRRHHHSRFSTGRRASARAQRGAVLAAVEELRPKIEVAVKSGALPVVLGRGRFQRAGDHRRRRRYYRDVSLIDMDRDAGLNVPATTPSGCMDGMVISHISGRGAPELVRFWGEPPLVREPEIAIFGIARLDEPEKEFLDRSPLRRYIAEDVQSMGATEAAEQALERMHGRPTNSCCTSISTSLPRKIFRPRTLPRRAVCGSRKCARRWPCGRGTRI